ncbi:TetR family transcriptional regulator [Streptomyces sp. NPDC058330]|uniref:TetR family transcriptional regulator n=1 Tax=Streptomyces sp. NPDC058330 TaxID=3346449 RepID=UPI0036EFE1D1
MPPHPHANLRRVPVQQRSAERLARILDAGAELLDETGYEQLSTRAVADRAGVPIGSVYRFFPNKRALVDALAERNLDVYAERIAGRLADIPASEWRAAIDAVLDEYLAMKRAVPGFGLVDFGPPVPVADAPDEANRRVAGRLAALLAGHLGRAPGRAAAVFGRGAEPVAGPEPGPDADVGAGPDAADGPGGAGAEPGSGDPASVDPASVDPASVDPASVDPASVDPAPAGPASADPALLRAVLVCVEAADALLQLAFRTDPSGDPALISETRVLLRAYLAQVFD